MPMPVNPHSTLKDILNNIPGGVAVFSERGGRIHLEYTNPGFYTLHHGSKEYWSRQSDNPVDWLSAGDRHLFMEELAAVQSGARKEGSVTYRIVGEDGNLYWVNNQFRPAYAQDGAQYYYASFLDMDGQKASEQELVKVRQIYDDAAQLSKLIIWTYDSEKHCVHMLQSGYTGLICQKLGIPAVIKNFPESIAVYVDAQDRQAFLETYRAIDAGEPAAECIIRFKLPSQKEQQYERMALRRIQDKNGQLLTIYGFGQNITDQKMAEDKFARAYKQINDPKSYGSFHLNLTQNRCDNGKRGSSKIKSVLELQNSGTVDGYFADFAKLIADEDVRAEFYRRFDRKLLLKNFNKGVEKISLEYPVVYENGMRHWREGFLDLVKNPYTDDIEAFTYSFDIDGRKRDEFLMKKLLDVSFDYIGIIHPTTKTFEFRSLKPAIYPAKIGELLDYEQCCAYVRSLITAAGEQWDYDALVALPAIIEGLHKNNLHKVTYIRHTEGKVFCIQLLYTWLEQPDGDILMIRSDVTDAYAREQEQFIALKKAKHEAETANLAKSEFISRISHDIRTPLNGIIGMLKFAKEDIADKDKALAELNKVSQSSHYLLSLLNDVLDISKAESGKIELHPEPYPFDEYMQGLRNIFTPLCNQKGQKLVIHEGHHAHGKGIIVDRVRFDQITVNLLSNAVKYTPRGGTITYTSASDALPDGRIACSFTIQDTGIGMSKQFQQTMFEPFTQEHDNPGRSKATTGTGLGLSIVKKLIDLMGGTITLQSERGRGTTVTVTLTMPAATPEELARCRSRQLAQDLPESNTPLHGRILLAEDNVINTEIATRILRGFNLHVDAVRNGQAALDKFTAAAPGTYDVILLDIQMPILDGYQTATKLRALERPDVAQLPIIAMTADVFADAVAKSKAAGMNDHVAKPIDSQALYATLAQYLS